MSSSPELLGRLLVLSGGLAVDSNMEDTLTRVCALAVDALPACDFAGITIMRDGKPETTAFTDPTSPEIDAAQYESGSGPCLDAFRQGRAFFIEDTHEELRWPEFAKAAADHGIRSTMSLPLNAEESTLGALNLYSGAVRAFPETDTEEVELFATHGAVVLANAQAYWASQTLSQQLREAMSSRAVIEQAKGVLMGRHRIDADAAFEMLKVESQRSNRKLRVIAQETIDSLQATVE
jgi:GAF domain-containing protein